MLDISMPRRAPGRARALSLRPACIDARFAMGLAGNRAMRSDMTRLACCLALFILVPRLASAHDFWIEPSTFRPSVGERVTASLRVGEDLRGDAVPRIPTLID